MPSQVPTGPTTAGMTGGAPRSEIEEMFPFMDMNLFNTALRAAAQAGVPLVANPMDFKGEGMKEEEMQVQEAIMQEFVAWCCVCGDGIETLCRCPVCFSRAQHLSQEYAGQAIQTWCCECTKGILNAGFQQHFGSFAGDVSCQFYVCFCAFKSGLQRENDRFQSGFPPLRTFI